MYYQYYPSTCLEQLAKAKELQTPNPGDLTLPNNKQIFRNCMLGLDKDNCK
jgi:hypothetical protein